VGRITAETPTATLDGVTDRTPHALRGYTGLRLVDPGNGQQLGAATGTTPTLTAPLARPVVFELLPDQRGGLRMEALNGFASFGRLVQSGWWPLKWLVLPNGRTLLAGARGDSLAFAPGAQDSADSEGENGDAHNLDVPMGFSPLSVSLGIRHDDSVLVAAAGMDGILLGTIPPGGPTRVHMNMPHAHGAALSVDLSESVVDGSRLLASGHWDGTVRVWEASYSNSAGELAHVHELAEVASPAWSVAWGIQPNGLALLASGHDDGGIRVWDGTSGLLLATCAPCPGRVDAVAWSVGANGRNLLASGHSDGTVRLWTWQTGALLHEFHDLTAPGLAHVDVSSTVGWLRTSRGALWLYASGETGSRIWELDTDLLTHPAGGSSEDTAPPGRRQTVPSTVYRGLVGLTAAGVWPPLGLLDDLVRMTGPGDLPPLDERLRVLADHPGLRALRELGWPTRSRVGLAALLTADLAEPDTIPPPDRGPRELLDALRHALSGPPDPAPRREPALAALRDAADAVTGRTVALLAVVGPEAVGEDPALPLRLVQQAPAMPALDLRRLRLLTAGTPDAIPRAGSTVHAPGSGGISHSGRLTRILPSQLALPEELLTIRYVRRELLYRLHSSSVRWAPEPLTLVLDNTPATFGPSEVVLRSLAHLLVTSLWSHGRHALLIGVDRPGLVRPMFRPVDLATLWTLRSLELPRLDAALATAASKGLPAVVLAPHHLVEDHGIVPGPQLRLATTHLLDDLPRSRPPDRYHVHLPPTATGSQLALAAGALMTGDRML
jgi:hypothetical protein